MYAIKVQDTKWDSPSYVRVYKNNKQWVRRRHFKTATQFKTQDEAQAMIKRFELEDSLYSVTITTY